MQKGDVRTKAAKLLCCCVAVRRSPFRNLAYKADPVGARDTLTGTSKGHCRGMGHWIAPRSCLATTQGRPPNKTSPTPQSGASGIGFWSRPWAAASQNRLEYPSSQPKPASTPPSCHHASRSCLWHHGSGMDCTRYGLCLSSGSLFGGSPQN
jgi:hypothetical protein